MFMRAFRFLHLALFSVLVASSAALYAQDEKPQQEEKPKQEEPKRQDQKQQEQKQQDQKQEEKQTHNEGRQEQAQQGHARPAGKSGHIPDDHFRAQFGRSHTFRAQRPRIVDGQPRFEYAGYSFVLIDAWPADWAYTDDCYIDSIDGEYFLFDLNHPGVRIALFVVL